jgi:hypothetical protein
MISRGGFFVFLWDHKKPDTQIPLEPILAGLNFNTPEIQLTMSQSMRFAIWEVEPESKSPLFQMDPSRLMSILMEN